MALKILDHGSHEYRQMVKLRDDVLRKPLGLGFTPQELEEEKGNMLIEWLVENEKLFNLLWELELCYFYDEDQIALGYSKIHYKYDVYLRLEDVENQLTFMTRSSVSSLTRARLQSVR